MKPSSILLLLAVPSLCFALILAPVAEARTVTSASSSSTTKAKPIMTGRARPALRRNVKSSARSSSSAKAKAAAAQYSSAMSDPEIVKRLKAGEVDTLPFADPRSALLVFDEMTPVMAVCPFDVGGKNTDLSTYIQLSGIAMTRETYVYDMASKKLVGLGLTGSDGKFTFAESDEGLAPSEKPVRTVYFRYKMVPFVKNPAYRFEMKVSPVACDQRTKNLTYQLLPAAVTDILPSGPETAVLEPANGVAIGSFTFVGQNATDYPLGLKSIHLRSMLSPKIKISNVKMQIEGSADLVDCLYNNPPNILCDIPEYARAISGNKKITFIADVSRLGAAGTLQLQITDFGTFFEPGSVSWTSAYGDYSWVTPGQQAIKSTLFKSP